MSNNIQHSMKHNLLYLGVYFLNYLIEFKFFELWDNIYT